MMDMGMQSALGQGGGMGVRTATNPEEALTDLRRLHDEQYVIERIGPSYDPTGPIRGLTKLETSAKEFFDDAKLTSQEVRGMLAEIRASVWWKALNYQKVSVFESATSEVNLTGGTFDETTDALERK
jgi:hypothetical protein